MKLTVQDIFNFPELSKLTLIAGRGGLKKNVSHCGILDYEYDKDVSKKYYDYNYQMDGEFLTLTTFLYAKNDPNLIYDAVKNLVAKKGSGLIIKNIFKLPISDNVIRYANHMNFPIFVLNDSYPFFEDIIILINKAMERYESFYYREQKVNLLLDESTGDSHTIKKLIYDINPSIQDDILVITFRYNKGSLGPQAYRKIESKIYAENLLSPEDSVFYYENGFMIIISGSGFPAENIYSLIETGFHTLGKALTDDFQIGISSIHNMREELPEAIRESFYALRFSGENENPYTLFNELGPYRAILPNAGQPHMQRYMEDYISPLEKYDTEKKYDILSTVTEFVKCGGDLEKTGNAMGQHKNTIRYRMNRAGEILGINPFAPGDYEGLALAVRIYICSIA